MDSLSDAPKIQPFQFPNQIKRGDMARMSCSLMRGTVPVKFKWLKDGKSIEKESSVSITSNEEVSTLFIKHVDENSAGNYTCVVSSSKGGDSYSTLLNVKGTRLCFYS